MEKPISNLYRLWHYVDVVSGKAHDAALIHRLLAYPLQRLALFLLVERHAPRPYAKS
ncbi:MAG: hypothetical protein SPK71_02130 [Prevotella sp.]|nr:hypothetical protein [Prevotella sp.]